MSRICLVVDDSRVVRKVARRILESHGFEVTEAADGQKALDACREHLPDCVLLDWNMPVMDGMAFLQALRKEFGPENHRSCSAPPRTTWAISRRRSRTAPRNTS
jgi:two-component system chemotaxis response regulator CheY